MLSFDSRSGSGESHAVVTLVLLAIAQDIVCQKRESIQVMGAHGAGAKTLDDPFDRGIRSLRDGADSAKLADAYDALSRALAVYDPGLSENDAPVPSGHVYLAQLMAHDLILSAPAPNDGVPNENLVVRPLDARHNLRLRTRRLAAPLRPNP